MRCPNLVVPVTVVTTCGLTVLGGVRELDQGRADAKGPPARPPSKACQGALRLLQELLPDRVRVLAPRRPVMDTRGSIARLDDTIRS